MWPGRRGGGQIAEVQQRCLSSRYSRWDVNACGADTAARSSGGRCIGLAWCSLRGGWLQAGRQGRHACLVQPALAGQTQAVPTRTDRRWSVRVRAFKAWEQGQTNGLHHHTRDRWMRRKCGQATAPGVLCSVGVWIHAWPWHGSGINYWWPYWLRLGYIRRDSRI